MFEARILQGSTLKKIIEAIRELVVDANLDCNESGITMQVREIRHHKLLCIVAALVTSACSFIGHMRP